MFLSCEFAEELHPEFLDQPNTIEKISDKTQMQSLITRPTQLLPSSILDRKKKLYGASNLIDQSADTCWNSAQGSPQYLLIQFNRLVLVKELRVMFQGGFVGQDIAIEVSETLSEGQFQDIEIPFDDPEDTNELQDFDLSFISEPIGALKLIFHRSTDFYGRITMYHLDILGTEVN